MALGILDIVLLALSVVASAAIGIYYGVKGLKSTPLEYLLGGRSMKPLPLALSMMVGTISAITIMGNAGEMYAYGTQLWVMDLGIVLGLVIVAKVFIPIMYPLHMVSLYQYVERRFNSRWLRQATVLLQLLGGYTFIGFLLYPPSIALQAFTGLSIISNIVIIGSTCTLYSAFGGVKAVVYADVLQSLVMLAGVLAIVIQGAVFFGGIDNVWDIAYHENRIEFFNWNLDPYQRHSFWLCITMGFFFTLGTYGVNQSQTQRYFSTGSVQQAQWVLYYAAMGMVLLRALIHLSGLVMFVYFKDCDPLTAPGSHRDPSIVVVTYVLKVLTQIPGLTGLFVAAIYAAVLSSVSTQLNSMTALLWEDFLKVMPIFANWSEVKVGGLQKVLVFSAGVLGIILGLAVSQLGWSFLRALFAINGALSGPLIGLFLTAVYLPWVNSKGASAGFAVSIFLSVWIAIGQLTQPKTDFLPLSRAGCPVANTTVALPFNLTTTTTSTTPITITTPAGPSLMSTLALNSTLAPESIQPSDTAHPLYGLSYCLNSLWGTLLCIIVALIVTAVTGFNKPTDVEEKLIAPQSWVLFQRSLILQGKEFFCKTILRRSSHIKEENDADIEVKDPLHNSMESKGAREVDVESRGAV
ncbi:sodium-coupled monocarboxylate transporter 1 [Procambarus clarkii]|uniref:sodium-coupled monocarboxylate transporter 1 n=1 Tax=Procambarus clarkii TaxID=6728 RepID=UPI001E671B90|nr:sodium-coupled monocarboxylate transporter 1-like [Procambarus clarkii]XP_045601788.1 sodium-coupled monocarboxylate transporter 1-like [Procambarus clarkii]XP_045601789.1 sodium-coupled monocarboxylate transporter 1-like [Procambarus clarkii]XP_045601790.1 sodium-coupled monocarboxylate transporter 1-like [Procambarus clarkii]